MEKSFEDTNTSQNEVNEASPISHAFTGDFNRIKFIKQGSGPKRKSDSCISRILSKPRSLKPKTDPIDAIENDLRQSLMNYISSPSSNDSNFNVSNSIDTGSENIIEADQNWLNELDSLIECASLYEPLSLNEDPDESTQNLICQTEFNIIPNVAEYFKKSKAYFIHQLAYTQNVIHSVSKATLKKLFHSEDIEMTRFNVKISSEIFMRNLLVKADNDAQIFNNPKILFEIVNERNQSNETALMIATRLNRASMVELLLKYSACPNMFNLNGHNSLHQAVLRGSYEAFQILMHNYYLNLRNISSINQLDAEGNTALALAIINNKKKIVTNGSNLFEVDNLALIRDLLYIGADVNLANNDQDTLVHLICKNNHDTTGNSFQIKIELLRLLKPTLEQLSEAKNIYGKTPIDCWIGFRFFNSAIVSYLLTILITEENFTFHI